MRPFPTTSTSGYGSGPSQELTGPEPVEIGLGHLAVLADEIAEGVFDAPRELVFKAWAEPERWVHWLGERGISGKVIQSARRPGDTYRYYMRDAQGGDHWLQGVFRELVEPERLAFTWGFTDEGGYPTSPETIVEVTLEDQASQSASDLASIASSRDLSSTGCAGS